VEAEKEITVLKNGTRIWFGRGRFDYFCIFISTPLYGIYDYVCIYTHGWYGPVDDKFFTKIKELGCRYGPDRVYNDFLKFYIRAAADVDPATIQLISDTADGYGRDRDYVEIMFILLYAMLIAEENRPPRMPFKKRLKRLAMYQLLKDNPPKSPREVANFSKHKRAGEIVPAIAQRNLYI